MGPVGLNFLQSKSFKSYARSRNRLGAISEASRLMSEGLHTGCANTASSQKQSDAAVRRLRGITGLISSKPGRDISPHLLTAQQAQHRNMAVQSKSQLLLLRMWRTWRGTWERCATIAVSPVHWSK